MNTKSNLKPNYIIYSPAFDQDEGGAIFLHELVHGLNNAGEKAYLWPFSQPLDLKAQLKRLWRKPAVLWRSNSFKVDDKLKTPIASGADLSENSIVVYPEITRGNPLKAKNVARWLLYKPGLRHPYSFGPNEVFFRAGEFCDLPEITGGAHDLTLWKLNPIYQNQERPNRKGACYIVRKGELKPRIPETENAIQIDGKSHEEICEIFNNCEVFYSYDEATFYSQYAAICGCLSIVVPGLYSDRQEWTKHHKPARYGIAYGVDDTEHALKTRHLLIDQLMEQVEQGNRSVENFVKITKSEFGFID